MKKIIIVLASELKNLELANKVREEIALQGCESTIIKLVDLDLPLYSSRAEKTHNPAELLAKEIPLIQEASGFVFIAPEYNGSTPPIFSNFLAWVSRSTKNWRELLNGKPAALGTYSGGAGFNVLLAMRQQLSYVGMNIVGRSLQFHSKYDFNEVDIKAVVTQLLKLTK